MDKNLPPKEPNEKRKQSLSSLARYSGIGAQIGAAVTLGILAGKWLDKHFQTTQPVYTAGLAILGVVVGLYVVFRDILKK